MPAGLQRMADVLQRDPLHVRAEIAGPDELHVGVEHGNVVAHRALRQQHDPGRPLLADEVRHRRRRAGEIGFRDHFGRALRMRQDGHVRVIFAQLPDVGRCKQLVHLAMALPCDDLHVRLRGDVLREIFIRQHDHALGAERLHDLQRIARGAADVGFRLHRRRGVDIGDDGDAGIARGDGVGQRTARREIGDQHGLFRVQQLGRLGHEVHAGQHDDVGIDLGGFARQQQAVAHDVGDAVEDFRRLIVVREDDGVTRSLEFEDGVDVLGEGCPFGRRDDSFDPVVKR